MPKKKFFKKFFSETHDPFGTGRSRNCAESKSVCGANFLCSTVQLPFAGTAKANVTGYCQREEILPENEAPSAEKRTISANP